ncbi:MAG TPA: P1 family peptidase [Gaiellaceae bacterium]|nr:P1 family peptidase [Gaiellaceae bacterium]
MRARARELGIAIGSLPPGPENAITDVPGVRVGHATIVEGESVRTGVTVVLPHEGNAWDEPVFAGAHRLNGNGELTGLEWIRESGLLTSPVGLTNTHSVGLVRDALVAAEVESRGGDGDFWSLPVVGETWDGVLNDIGGQHVRPEHVRSALADAGGGPVAEGSVGGGTGMICHGFKGGIGTASRLVGAHVVGVLVQANYGRRERLRIDGVPVGELIPAQETPLPGPPYAGPGGSIIVLVATSAPLLPDQCERLAQRAGLGVGRMGGVGENSSGDLFLCFATGNRGLPAGDEAASVPATVALRMVPAQRLTPYFDAVVEATEEAIVNALCAAETMSGHRGALAHELPLERLRKILAGRAAF